MTDSPDVPSTPRLDQFKGCLLGCALGDAVGAWAERKPTLAAQEYVLNSVLPVKFKTHSHHGGLRFGAYTDDTQLSRELVLSIVDEGDFVPQGFADRIADIFAHNAVVGYGRSTQEAAVRLLDGLLWDQAGTPPPAAGNGGAMRAAPIGLLRWNNTARLVEDAANQAFITHKAAMSVAPAVAVAAATAMCLNASKDTSHPGERGWWHWVARIVDRSSEHFGADIRELTERVFTLRAQSKAPEVIRDEILAWVLEQDDQSWQGVSPWARTSVLWSFFCVMAHPKDIWEAIALAIWPGGDTDSTAAMTGAIVGTYVGLEKFPTDVIEKVSPLIYDARAPEWGWSQLEELAARLYETVMSPPEPKTRNILDLLQGHP